MPAAEWDANREGKYSSDNTHGEETQDKFGARGQPQAHKIFARPCQPDKHTPRATHPKHKTWIFGNLTQECRRSLTRLRSARIASPQSKTQTSTTKR